MFESSYRRLTTSLGMVDWSARTRVAVAGADRATFLQKFLTNDIVKLLAGEGCETFICNAQGKIVGFLNVYCETDRIVLESAPGQATRIVNHLDRYILRDDVKLTDESHSTAAWLFAGPEIDAVLSQFQNESVSSELGIAPLSSATIQFASVRCVVRRHNILGRPGSAANFEPRASIALECSIADAPVARSAIVAAFEKIGADPTECILEALDALRVETGMPEFGRDIGETNLPQEARRDDVAINFHKGCYLGQETVARIDALGHVNWTLRRLRFFGPGLPAEGAELSREGKPLVKVRSVAQSLDPAQCIALAFVRRNSDRPGQRLSLAHESEGGTIGFEMVVLP